MSTAYNFSGTWTNTHWYPDATDSGEENCVHRMTAYQRGDKLVLENESEAETPHMTINLTIDGNLATGTWAETTDAEGDYEGITYSGAMQLLVSDEGRRMEGKWVGVGRHKQDDGSYEPRIYTGRWLMERAAGENDLEAAAATDPATVTGTTES